MRSNDSVIHSHVAVYFHRNAVRPNAGEDRTVPHTVPLRGGAMQTHACVCSDWQKVFPPGNRRRFTADIQTHTAMKPHTCSHAVLCHKLYPCSRFIFQKLINIYFWTENRICCIADAELFKSYPKKTKSFQFLTKLLNEIFINSTHAASPLQPLFQI